MFRQGVQSLEGDLTTMENRQGCEGRVGVLPRDVDFPFPFPLAQAVLQAEIHADQRQEPRFTAVHRDCRPVHPRQRVGVRPTHRQIGQ